MTPKPDATEVKRYNFVSWDELGDLPVEFIADHGGIYQFVLASDYDQLRAELAECRKDAERYNERM